MNWSLSSVPETSDELYLEDSQLHRLKVPTRNAKANKHGCMLEKVKRTQPTPYNL
jgi:hypothetical protein